MWCCSLIEIRNLAHQKVKSSIIFITVNRIYWVFLIFCLFENALNLEFFCSKFGQEFFCSKFGQERFCFCLLLVQRVPCNISSGFRILFDNGNGV